MYQYEDNYADPVYDPDEWEYDLYIEDDGHVCCENYDAPMWSMHEEDCLNYDGAPLEQWEVTTPSDVYYTDDYLDWIDEQYWEQETLYMLDELGME